MIRYYTEIMSGIHVYPHNIKKTITYGVMHLVVAFLVALAITQNFWMALGIGMIEPAVQTIAYHFHEKFWVKINKQQSHQSQYFVENSDQ